MHYKIFILACLFFFALKLSFSQDDRRIIKEHKTVFITEKACDCKDAIELKLTKAASCIYPNAPKGFGIQEIKSTGKADQSFEEEHNTTWYLLSIKSDGELTFEITPFDSTNDYDFLVYRYTDSFFCSNFKQRNVSALRSNISLPTLKSAGKTGLSSKATTNFTKKKFGATFSKSLNVKADEKYMLVIDNVTKNGKGYGIEFNCIVNIVITGKVTNELKQPLKTSITLLDRNNSEIVKVYSSDDGNYKLITEVKEEIDYSLLFYNDSCMPISTIVNTSMIDMNIGTLTIDQVLYKLKAGATYNVLYFSQPSLLLNVESSAIKGLVQIMNKYPKMRIQIQGHSAKNELTKSKLQTNGGLKIDKIIAEERADYIYSKLLLDGIKKERIEKIGFSSDKPLFPNPLNEEEKNKNKRVSIKILSL